MANGGEVKHFCQSKGTHGSDCEYHLDEGTTQGPLSNEFSADSVTSGAQPSREIGEPIREPAPAEQPQPPQPEAKDFDPDAFIANHDSQGGGDTSGFDPDKFLQDHEPNPENQPSIKPDESEAFDPDAFLKENEGKVTETEDSAIEGMKTFAEAMPQGFIGGLAKVIETKSGLANLSDIEQRAEDYPVAHSVGKIAGTLASWIGGPAEKITSAVGSRILGNLLVGVSYAASDNITKAMLGQPGGDPKTAVAATLAEGGIDGLMNVATEGLFSTIGGPLSPFNKAPELAEKAMTAMAKNPISTVFGLGTAHNLIHAVATHTTPMFVAGEAAFYMGYEAFKTMMGPTIDGIIGSTLNATNKHAGDALMYALEKTNFLAIPTLLRYGVRASRGVYAMTKPIEDLMKAGASELVKPVKESVHDKIREWVDDGGTSKEMDDWQGGKFGQGGSNGVFKRSKPDTAPQRNFLQRDLEPQHGHMFAKGGEVQAQGVDHFANAYPTENILLHQARARVSNYLNAVKPRPKADKLPFDSDMPTAKSKRDYNEAVKIAASPLSILNKVNDGTLTPDHVSHLQNMYPEVYSLLAEKITKRITQAQLDGERPPYKKRQSMSLFLGAHLDSTFTPQSIQTLQMQYAPKQMPQPPAKSKTAPLAKGPSASLTNDQARSQRLQNQKA